MNICLIHPWWAKGGRFDTDGFIPNNYSHVGLGYLKSVLDQEGHNVIMADVKVQNLEKEDIEKIIRDNNVDIVGITSYSYNLMQTMSMCRFIKKRFPSVFIVVGGVYPTLATDDAANMINADCFVLGEGEETIKVLVSAIENNNDWHNISGIAYLDKDKKIVVNERRELISDLDSIPFPYRMPGLKTAAVFQARGCYGNCIFCSQKAFFRNCIGTKIRRRSPEHVVKELVSIVKEHDIKYINFHDGNFAVSSEKDREWFNKFYTLMKNNKIDTNISILMRPNEAIASADLIEKFIEVGLKRIFLGIESFNQNQLDFFNRDLSVEQAFKAIEAVSKLDVNLYISLVLFDPRITVDDMIVNATKLRSVQKYFNEHFIMKPVNWVLIAYEGTAARDYVVENGLFTITNELYYNFMHSDVQELYNARVSWYQEIKMFSGWSDWFYAKEYCSESIKQKLLDFYNKLFLLDVDVLLYSCDLAKTGVPNPEIHERTLEKHGDQLNQLKTFYKQIDDEAQGCLTRATSTTWLQSQDHLEL